MLLIAGHVYKKWSFYKGANTSYWICHRSRTEDKCPARIVRNGLGIMRLNGVHNHPELPTNSPLFNYFRNNHW